VMIQLATDSPLRNRLAEAACAHVHSEFSLDRMVSAYARLIGFERV
jgi:hypothetical protein